MPRSVLAQPLGREDAALRLPTVFNTAFATTNGKGPDSTSSSRPQLSWSARLMEILVCRHLHYSRGRY
jgi:hypothetical protein